MKKFRAVSLVFTDQYGYSFTYTYKTPGKRTLTVENVDMYTLDVINHHMVFVSAPAKEKRDYKAESVKKLPTLDLDSNRVKFKVESALIEVYYDNKKYATPDVVLKYANNQFPKEHPEVEPFDIELLSSIITLHYKANCGFKRVRYFNEKVK